MMDMLLDELKEDRLDFQSLKTTGIKVNYLYVCERKLWLFDRGIQMESKSDKVLIGKLTGESSYPRENKKEIYHTQLNPMISYLHEPRERRYSLSLDIAEIFKPLIADPIIFKLVNNNMIKLEDFEEDVSYCYMNENGRKKFLKEFDQKLTTTIKHRKLKRNVSYRTLIRLECYKLIKHFLGDDVYSPFKAWW
jgi:CRISPR/Cas system-associated exonuclease Cas4 (RecB family)